MFNPIYRYEWQNPALRATIYPFREKKLRDFLLYYREIDLWKEKSSAPVDPQTAAELVQEITRVQTALGLAKVKKTETDQAIKALNLKYRALLSSPDVRLLAQKKVNLQLKLASLEAKKASLERQVDWYRRFAPDHPYCARWQNELAAAIPPYEAAQADLQSVIDQYNQAVAPFETEAKSLQIQSRDLAAQIITLGEELKKLPKLTPQGTVTQSAAVQWQVYKYSLELSALDHDHLLGKVLERFDAEPARFPKWLQYMIIHFSGMRYASAHGSWADPRQLLKALRSEGANVNLGTLNLDQACAQAVATLQQELSTVTDPQKIQSINIQIKSLNNPVQRQNALMDYQADHAAATVDRMTDAEVLGALKAMKDTFPDWVWKEIVARTDLRLEVTDTDWEKLSPDEAKERWNAEYDHWRAIMNAWERRDITAWRQEHELTLSLIVTRAVCNEIAEHIQHLRGIKPAAGLTAKPVWYIRQQAINPQQAYFKKPMQAADFKNGASILFLGWVDRKPNPWQIARPLQAVNLLPVEAKPARVNKRYQPQADTWRYAVLGDEFIRTSQILVPQASSDPEKKQKWVPRTAQEWLRWTHEATVIEVARMADGFDYVLTFETGQIGVNLRPLGRMVNHWDIYVGYVPPAPVDPARLDEMLDRQSIVLPAPVPAPAPMPMAAPRELPTEAYARALAGRSAAELALECWQALTPRQRQAVALACRGYTTRQIAECMHITTDTVQRHISNALHRFGLHGRASLCQVLSSLDLRPWIGEE